MTELRFSRIVSVTAFFNSEDEAESVINVLKGNYTSIKKKRFCGGIFVIFKGLDDTNLDLNIFKNCSRFSYREDE